MAKAAKTALGAESLDVVADRGYSTVKRFWPASRWGSR
jgi:hypothetical protein